MPRPDDDLPPLRPSLLDRLIDDDPAAEVDLPVRPQQQLRLLRLSIRRDVEALLNTRRRCLSTPPDRRRAVDSLLEYGLPDLNATRIGTDEEREILLEEIERTIKKYEPRFKAVRVAGTSRSSQDRNLRFDIRGTVYADPTEELEFPALVEAVARMIEVQASR